MMEAPSNREEAEEDSPEDLDQWSNIVFLIGVVCLAGVCMLQFRNTVAYVCGGHHERPLCNASIALLMVLLFVFGVRFILVVINELWNICELPAEDVLSLMKQRTLSVSFLWMLLGGLVSFAFSFHLILANPVGSPQDRSVFMSTMHLNVSNHRAVVYEVGAREQQEQRVFISILAILIPRFVLPTLLRVRFQWSAISWLCILMVVKASLVLQGLCNFTDVSVIRYCLSFMAQCIPGLAFVTWLASYDCSSREPHARSSDSYQPLVQRTTLASEPAELIPLAFAYGMMSNFTVSPRVSLHVGVVFGIHQGAEHEVSMWAVSLCVLSLILLQLTRGLAWMNVSVSYCHYRYLPLPKKVARSAQHREEWLLMTLGPPLSAVMLLTVATEFLEADHEPFALLLALILHWLLLAVVLARLRWRTFELLRLYNSKRSRKAHTDGGIA